MTIFRSLLALGAVLTLAPGAALTARAQDGMQMPDPATAVPVAPPIDPAIAPVSATAAARLITVTAGDLAGLKAQLPRRYALSLRASLADLNENPTARDALLEWAAGGGVVFLHTDAAQLFGYETVPAREANKRVAGQLLGRARVALPFASQPLLVNARAGRTSDPSRLPGISVVFYSMQPGDQLVVSHPSGTPLLTVTDLASNDTRTLYASAVAPWGRGWAVFTPDSIDQKRGDGAAFARNLLTMVPGGNGTVIAPRWVSIAQSAVSDPTALVREIDTGLAMRLAPPVAPPLPQFGTGATPPTATPPNGEPPVATVQGMAPQMQTQAAPQVLPPADTTLNNADPNGANAGADNAQDPPAIPTNIAARGAVIMVSRGEALAMRAALAGPNAGSVQALLQARIAVLQNNLVAATQALADVPQEASETQFVLGEIAATRTDDVTLSSLERAAAAQTAAQAFSNASAAQPLLSVGGAPTPGAMNGGAMNGGTMGAPTVFGATSAQLQGWSAEFNRLAGMFALEPPLAQNYGNGPGAITVRYFNNGVSSPNIVAAAQSLATANGFGWRGDREELLLFPSLDAYVAYRNAAGLTVQNVPLPAAGGGDVIGQRILLVGSPDLQTQQVFDPTTGLVLNTATLGNSVSLLARLHVYALLGAWFDGMGRIPAWFALGMENGADNVVAGNNNLAQIGQTLRPVAQAGGLLSPEQFEAFRVTPNQIAAAQSASIVNYFYQAAGPGAVTEWVQRLAQGQDPDAALTQVAEGDQNGLFTTWRNAQFGAQNFPDAGNQFGNQQDPNQQDPQNQGIIQGFPNQQNPQNFPGTFVPGGMMP